MARSDLDLSRVVVVRNGRVMLHLKVVPGASRDRLVGLLGDRLKVSVTAPPEGGKANQAVCRLLARSLGLNRSDFVITAGHSQPIKEIALDGITAEQIIQKLSGILARIK